MAAQDPYWEWIATELAHPDGRANGGEPCVSCQEPVPAGSAWILLDRHVCSSRCNRNLKARTKRRHKKAGEGPPPPPADPYVGRDPYLFETWPVSDADGELPYDFLGWGPKPGDIVERDGSITAYGVPHASYLEFYSTRATEGRALNVIEALHVATGSFQHFEPASVRSLGIRWGVYAPNGSRISDELSTADGSEWEWVQETIRDIDDNGVEYSWQAQLCLPRVRPGSRWNHTMWTPIFAERSARRHRTSSTTGRHGRRLRMYGSDGTIERIDPLEVFVEDGWICQICGDAVDEGRSHPDPFSASLDHTVPLAAGGRHTRANVQLAHLQCNIRKGAKT